MWLGFKVYTWGTLPIFFNGSVDITLNAWVVNYQNVGIIVSVKNELSEC
jgi:hypothetical protein